MLWRDLNYKMEHPIAAFAYVDRCSVADNSQMEILVGLSVRQSKVALLGRQFVQL